MILYVVVVAAHVRASRDRNAPPCLHARVSLNARAREREHERLCLRGAMYVCFIQGAEKLCVQQTSLADPLIHHVDGRFWRFLTIKLLNKVRKLLNTVRKNLRGIEKSKCVNLTSY